MLLLVLLVLLVLVLVVLLLLVVVGFSGGVVAADGSSRQQRPRHFLRPGARPFAHTRVFAQLEASLARVCNEKPHSFEVKHVFFFM